MTTLLVNPVSFCKCSGRLRDRKIVASIKSYDNRAQLIPLPIINARINLNLSDESTERGLAIAPITRIMI